ncbi:hypothetical protein GT04_004375 [Salmonella enterica subsp. enterica]|nr:hypothetical protein [Salmonella enterica subsp. enterica serovar Lexington]EDV9690060.1 hypothetical protein [Salmonella enterica subsp. enterica serovar Lexington]
MVLLNRIDRLNTRNAEGIVTPEVDLDALIDIIYVNCRSLFCEDPNLKKNYTMQNCLRSAGYKDEADLMDEVIQGKEFSDKRIQKYSFKEWVKFVTNKSIAHKENLSESKTELLEYRYAFLNDNINLCEFQYYIYRIHNVYEEIVKGYANKLLQEH